MEKSALVFICNSFLSDERCILQGREQSSSLRIIWKDLPTELCFSEFPCGISYSSGIGHIKTIRVGNCSDLV